MTQLIASNQLTLTNVNDGQSSYTHTAYAWSADGSDRFTTVYPNLNLLDFNSGVTLGRQYGWPANTTSPVIYRAIFKKVKVTPNNKYTISADWSNTAWLNVYAFTNESDTTAVARYGSFGGYGDGSWESNFSGGYAVAKNMTFTVPSNVNYVGISYSSLDTNTLTLQKLLNGKPKLEEGSTATPWMPSASEVKTSDYPSYIGQCADYTQADSTDPTKYRWFLTKGIDGKDGQTPYIHWAYSDNADGTGLTTSDNGQRYIGQYSDYTQTDSTDKTKYKWADRWAKIEVGGRNLAQKTSSDWSTPYTWFNGTTNTIINLYKIFIDDLAVGDTLKSRIVLKYTNIVPASGQTAKIWLQGDGNVTGWNAGAYNGGSAKPISGSGEMVFELEFKITSNHLKNKFWNWMFRTDYIASGSLQWKLAKVEKGTVFTDWSRADEDIQADIETKADQALTQQQLNALNEQRGIYEAELQARATASELEEWINAYNNYIKANDQNKKEAEASLISTSIRVADVEKVLGAMKERWDFILNYMDVSEDGLFFGKKDGSAEVRVYGDRISMFVAGNEVMYISQDTININNGIFSTSIQIGRFKEEQYGLNPDINIIRYVG